MAAVLVIARLLEPSNELHLAEDWYRTTALEDLLGLPSERVNDDRLYRALDCLLPHKQALEQHLRRRFGELFALKYDLLFYDVTSTYFEGLAERNPLARRGYSRDHRSDCKQVCIALVVTREGLPVGYEVFAGNRTDVTTVEDFAQRIEQGLAKLGRRLERARKALDRGKLERQIGRLLERNARAAGRYLIDLVEAPSQPARVQLKWSVRPEWDDWARHSEGRYVLRTNTTDWDAEQLWRTYIQLSQAEAAFRIHKSELLMRPISHQREDRVQAHILVCLLAYVLWKTLEQWQRRAGLGNSPRTILAELGRIQSADVVLPLAVDSCRKLHIRCVVRPDKAQALLLDRLGLRLPERLRPPPLIHEM
jgi:transposase